MRLSDEPVSDKSGVTVHVVLGTLWVNSIQYHFLWRTIEVCQYVVLALFIVRIVELACFYYVHTPG